MNRKLTVKKERLAELSTDELNRVVGGAPPTIRECISGSVCSPTNLCTTAITCGCGPTEWLSQLNTCEIDR